MKHLQNGLNKNGESCFQPTPKSHPTKLPFSTPIGAQLVSGAQSSLLMLYLVAPKATPWLALKLRGGPLKIHRLVSKECLNMYKLHIYIYIYVFTSIVCICYSSKVVPEFRVEPSKSMPFPNQNKSHSASNKMSILLILLKVVQSI